jgi:hypothetical protein
VRSKAEESKSKQARFVELAIAGEILDPDCEVDGYVQRWHESDSELSIEDWLGFSREEYALFVEKPAFLRAILMARRNGMSLKDAIDVATDGGAQIAARGVPPEDIPKIRKWLEQTGRL